MPAEHTDAMDLGQYTDLCCGRTTNHLLFRHYKSKSRIYMNNMTYDHPQLLLEQFVLYQNKLRTVTLD
jgi:hypothetical protein